MSSSVSKISVPDMPSFTKTYYYRLYPAISVERLEGAASGKNVVVTGGGTGIGKAIALSFARAGAKSVAIFGRRREKLEETAGEIRARGYTGVVFEVVDLMDRDATEAAFGCIAANVGTLDVLVSNAGVAPLMQPVLRCDAGTMMDTLNLNLLTAFYALQAWVPLSGSGATLINISSMTAHAVPAPMVPNFAYAMSKAANLKMVDFFAHENPGIHVVNVQPGIINTDLGGPDKPVYVAPDTTDLPAQFCVWLLTPQAQFLKSKFVWANWDFEELMARRDEVVKTRALTWGLEGVPV
ncbi:hypothetical protein GE09DRAFT_1243962 [Coniochaeta sp. 2T2.1]|nr:hypothetical protein GE09DRAFT_1243962 [Coniochaeta sp. 2T2.1]